MSHILHTVVSFTSSAGEGDFFGIGHDEFVQFGQIVGRDTLACEMSKQDFVTEGAVSGKRIRRVLHHSSEERKIGRCKEGVTQLAAYMCNTISQLMSFAAVKY